MYTIRQRLDGSNIEVLSEHNMGGLTSELYCELIGGDLQITRGMDLQICVIYANNISVLADL